MEPVVIEVRDQIARMEADLLQLKQIAGVAPATGPKELTLKERRELVAQLGQVNAKWKKEYERLNEAVKKAEDNEANLRARHHAGLIDVQRTIQERSDLGRAHVAERDPIVEALKQGKPKVIAEILAKISAEFVNLENSAPDEANTVRLSVREARIKKLMELHGAVEGSWHLLPDTDAEMLERLNRELAKMPSNAPKPSWWQVGHGLLKSA